MGRENRYRNQSTKPGILAIIQGPSSSAKPAVSLPEDASLIHFIPKGLMDHCARNALAMQSNMEDTQNTKRNAPSSNASAKASANAAGVRGWELCM